MAIHNPNISSFFIKEYLAEKLIEDIINKRVLRSVQNIQHSWRTEQNIQHSWRTEQNIQHSWRTEQFTLQILTAEV